MPSVRRSRLQLVPLVSVLAACGLAATPQAHAQAVTTSVTRPHVEALASERMQGREAGSPGERLAAEYLAEQLTRVGARPLPGLADMFSAFEFTAGSRDGGSRVTIARAEGPGSQDVSSTRAFGTTEDVQALSFSDDAGVTGEVVFAGYGIVVPESQNFGYDSYAGLDVTDKVVVVLRYFPEDADQATRAILGRYADLRYKAMAARQRGARALIVVTGPRSPNAGLTVPMRFDTALAGSGIPAASVSARVAAALFEGTRPLQEVQQEFDTGNPHVQGFELPNVTVTLETAVIRERRTANNVLAYLPATAPVDDLDKPWVVVGAHYDHLGIGAHGSSLAAEGDPAAPHVGADDNASGTAAVLAIAEALAAEPRRTRHLLIGFWSAEEIGLVGSSSFVNSAVVPADRIAAYVNFDMVGRMQNNRLAAQATGTSPLWPSLLERANVVAGFDLVLQPDPYQPTDVATFNQADIPSLSFTTGAHADYHKPSDTADKINYEDLDRIVEMAAAVVHRVMNADSAPQFTKVEQTSPAGSRAGLRIFTGTIPDYTSGVEGLMLGGVIGGGPAERAGLQKGDVIVEIAGQTIANIYDYTYALDVLKVGEPVSVAYLRNGERHETTLTPTARQ
jgi:hypothetical protein